MRVVITGGAGFIGDAVAAALREAGHAVVVADTAQRLARIDAAAHGCEALAFDFSRDAPPAGLFQDAAALVHLGCTTHPSHSMDAMAFDATSNIGPSIRLFEAARDAGVGRVVFASSGGTVYGAPSSLPVNEDAPTHPLSAYGVSKLAIEHYLSLIPGVRGISLRVGNPYGPGQLQGAAVGVVARYLTCVARSEPLEIWGDGSTVRDYVAIADVARAFVCAVTGDLPAGPYNVGSGVGTSLGKVIEAVFTAAQREVPVVQRPARNYDVPAIVLDCSRFSDCSGWHADTSFQVGVDALWRIAVDRHGAAGQRAGMRP